MPEVMFRVLAACPRRLKRCSSALVALTLSACTSTTLINTVPGGAHVSVDGKYLGVAPVAFSAQVTSSTTNTVALEREGYKPLQSTIAADQWTSSKVSATVMLGLTCLPLVGFVGLLWSTDYKPMYEFILEPDVNAMPSQPSRLSDEPDVPAVKAPGALTPPPMPFDPDGLRKH